jgi:hypothetical protein
MWDVRAQCSIFELATGNNAVTCMAWDSKHNSLFAATECRYVDRHGYHHGYRTVKMPKSSDQAPESDMDEEADDPDDDDWDDEKAWPKDAFHGEDYFGYTFDAGRHQICESSGSFVKCWAKRILRARSV